MDINDNVSSSIDKNHGNEEQDKDNIVNGNNKVEVDTTSSSNDNVCNGHDDDGEKNHDNDDSTTPAKKEMIVPKLTPSDRSKALAQSRILLDETISSLKAICLHTPLLPPTHHPKHQQSHQNDVSNSTATDQSYYGCIIELSKNQKSWKHDFTLDQLYQLNKKPPASSGNSNIIGSGRKNHGFNYHLKYDSTIEESEDFKKFIAKCEQMEEERKNRPKPVPGGVGVGGHALDDASKSGAGGESSSDGQPIAAIVLHLREKKANMRQSKSQKKNSSGSSNSMAVSSASTSTKKSSSRKRKSSSKVSEKGSVTATASGSKGGGKKSSRKKEGSGGKSKIRDKVPTVAPSKILMKPGSQ